jgi:hypothetical protein
MKKACTFLFLLIAIYGCKRESDQIIVKNTISELKNKFPQLSENNFERHIRTVKFGDKNIQIQLWGASNKVKNHSEIAVFLNDKNECYAVPLFSNKYRDYWNFEFDEPIPTLSPVNTTFEKEILNAMNMLSFRDTLNTCNEVMGELLNGIIQASNVYEMSEEIILEPCKIYDNELLEEYKDSCLIRVRQNYELIQKGMKPFKNYHIHNAHYDRHNHRIYQVLYKEKYFSKNCDFSIKVYRQDCNSHMFDL